MASLAVTATSTAATDGYPLLVLVAWLLLAALIVTPLYLALCWAWPFTNCRRCEGSGRRNAWLGKGFRHCSHCDGTGARLRVGRHVLNYLRRSRRASR